MSQTKFTLEETVLKIMTIHLCNNNNNFFIIVALLATSEQSSSSFIETKLNHNKSNVGFSVHEMGKPEKARKRLSEQSREQTNSTHTWPQVRILIPGHIGGR